MKNQLKYYYEYEKGVLEDIKNKYLKAAGNMNIDNFISMITSSLIINDYNVFRDICNIIYYDEILHNNDDYITKTIKYLNTRSIQYLGNDFVELARYIWNNIRILNGIIDTNNFNIYKIFCKVTPIDTYLSQAIISTAEIIAEFSNKIIINREYDHYSKYDLIKIYKYMSGDVYCHVYEEQYDDMDFDKLYKDNKYAEIARDKINKESAKRCEEWIKYIDLIKDKKYRDASKLINNNMKE